MNQTSRAAAVPTVQVDNDIVKVTEWRFAPGAETGWHRHDYDYVVVPVTNGRLLLETPKDMSWLWIPWVTLGAAGGIVALAAAAQGHLWRPLGIGMRVVCGIAGIALTFPGIIDDWVGGMVAARLIGLAILTAALVYEYRSPRRQLA